MIFSEQFSYGVCACVFEGYTHFPLSFNFRDIDFGCTMATTAGLAVVMVVAATTMMRKKTYKLIKNLILMEKVAATKIEQNTIHGNRIEEEEGKKAIQEQLSF